MMAWAEDRAPWRHDPSADPGTKTEGGAARCRPCLSLRDWYESGKSNDPSADPGTKTEGGAARCRPCLSLRDWYESGKSTMPDHRFSSLYLSTPVSPFHGEPLQSHHRVPSCPPF